MNYKSLGRSGLMASELCLGTMVFGEPSSRGCDEDQNWRILDVLEEIYRDHGDCTVSQIAIAWLRQQPAVDSVLIGVRTMAELEDNLGAVQLQLSDSEIEKLNQASALTVSYPYRFLQAWGK